MSGNRETVYIKADRNTEVAKPEVQLGDVIKVECTNPSIKANIKCQKLLKFSGDEKRIAVSILRVIACIHEQYPQVEIQNMGETDFIVTYENAATPKKAVHLLKTAIVVLISFFGSAFSIMSFNNDVNITDIFSKVYELFTGNPSDGFTIIELTYSIGLIIGILIFFNHFGKKRFSVDPTPIEVEMRLYENDLQTTLIENDSRKGKQLDVDTNRNSCTHRS